LVKPRKRADRQNHMVRRHRSAHPCAHAKLAHPVRHRGAQPTLHL